MKKETNLAFWLFVAGIALTFTFITVLQFFSITEQFFWWVGTLVLMHVGIVCFIISKKQFKKQELDVKRYFKREYYFLAWYLPVLACKILLPLIFESISFDSGTAENYIKVGAVLTMSAIFIAESTFNALEMRKQLKKDEEVGAKTSKIMIDSEEEKEYNP